MSIKNRLKPTNSKSTIENSHTPVCRSRSIDSMSVTNNEQIVESHSSTGGGLNDDKPASTATLAKTFRTLRKRLSRTSTSNKSELKSRRKSNQNENTGRSGGDDSGDASSTCGDDSHTPLTFTEIPSINCEAPINENSTAQTLKLLRSLPAEKTPSIITSPPPPSSSSTTITTTTDSNDKTNESENSANENTRLSKTWSSSTFTGAQLRGTCSLEYTEYMKEKSHKRKAHLIDLRKDDNQQQQLSPNTITSTSKNAISTSFPSYYSYTLTLFHTKGALT